MGRHLQAPPTQHNSSSQERPPASMKTNTAIIASVACNAILCIGLVAMTMGSSNNLQSAVATAMTTRTFSRAMTPAPTFRSAVAQAYCEEVVDPENNVKYEAMSFLNSFTRSDMEAQVNYMIQNGLIPCVEFDTKGVTTREHSRMPGYYDGRYWTMWKLPMFGATDASSVMAEVDECKANNPNSFIRILGFDNIKQVQCMGFLVGRPGQ